MFKLFGLLSKLSERHLSNAFSHKFLLSIIAILLYTPYMPPLFRWAKPGSGSLDMYQSCDLFARRAMTQHSLWYVALKPRWQIMDSFFYINMWASFFSIIHKTDCWNRQRSSAVIWIDVLSNCVGLYHWDWKYFLRHKRLLFIKKLCGDQNRCWNFGFFLQNVTLNMISNLFFVL